MPKKVYNVYPKENEKFKKTIVNLNDSIELLNYEKKLLLLDNREILKDTVFIKVPSKPKETIVIKRDEVIKEIDCTEFYTDSKRDSLWSKRITKKDNP